MRKNHSSAMYNFRVISLRSFAMLFVTALLLDNRYMYFNETSYICKAHSDDVSCKRTIALACIFFNYSPCNITKCNFVMLFFLFLKRVDICFYADNNSSFIMMSTYRSYRFICLIPFAIVKVELGNFSDIWE